MRWLLVAQDGWGLGHVSRQLGLARELRRLAPGDEFLFLTYSDATHLIAAEGFASVKLPAPEWFRKTEDHHIDDQRRLWVSIAVTNATATTYQPDAVVLDTFPVGNRGEFAIFQRLNCRRFLIAREVRKPLAHWEYHESLPRFHALLAPYAEGEVALPAPAGVPVHWVGPILVRNRQDLLSRAEARARLGLPREGRCCLVSFGGGGNPAYPRLEAWALQLAAAHPDWHFAFATPPLLQGAKADLGLTNAGRFAYYPMAECYSAFDAALSTVGSSAYELAFMGVPSILVPDVSPQKDEDFEAKARRVLGEKGGFVVKAFDQAGLATAFAAMNDPARLAAMTEDRATQTLPNGAVNAAAAMLRHLRPPRKGQAR
jgi:UDP-N-acetylglucosamine:LPS N-acetylglucosamine transferase